VDPTLDLSTSSPDDTDTKVRGLIALALQAAESMIFLRKGTRRWAITRRQFLSAARPSARS